MKRLRVLVVEDESMVAMDLETTILEIRPATVTIKTSVASTMKVLDEPFDFAFLDVNVTDGQTYEVASLLGKKGVPFAFVTGTSRDNLPKELKVATLITKPFQRSQVEEALSELER